MPQNRKPVITNIKGLSQPQVWDFMDQVNYALQQLNSGDPSLLDTEFFIELAEKESAIKPSNENEESSSLNQSVNFIGE